MNSTFSVKLSSDELGGVILPLPKELMEKLDWRIGDQLDLQRNSSGFINVVNLSVQTMYLSRARRDMSSLIRKLNRQNEPLDRVLIKRRMGGGDGAWLTAPSCNAEKTVS